MNMHNGPPKPMCEVEDCLQLASRGPLCLMHQRPRKDLGLQNGKPPSKLDRLPDSSPPASKHTAKRSRTHLSLGPSRVARQITVEGTTQRLTSTEQNSSTPPSSIYLEGLAPKRSQRDDCTVRLLGAGIAGSRLKAPAPPKKRTESGVPKGETVKECLPHSEHQDMLRGIRLAIPPDFVRFQQSNSDAFKESSAGPALDESINTKLSIAKPHSQANITDAQRAFVRPCSNPNLRAFSIANLVDITEDSVTRSPNQAQDMLTAPTPPIRAETAEFNRESSKPEAPKTPVGGTKRKSTFVDQRVLSHSRYQDLSPIALTKPGHPELIELGSESPKILLTPTRESLVKHRALPTISPPLKGASSAQTDSKSLILTAGVPPRLLVTESQPSRSREFDSAAFDILIYRQSGAQAPPKGVHVPRTASALPSEDSRVYVPANRRIQKMHIRSQEWHRNKEQEIATRGGRKAWFGKVIERQKWLRAKERVAEQHCDDTAQLGAQSVRQDPKAWVYNRVLDFGDVPEDKLPADVRENPAWAKACAWHREREDIKVIRRHGLELTEKETKAFYLDVFGRETP